MHGTQFFAVKPDVRRSTLVSFFVCGLACCCITSRVSAQAPPTNPADWQQSSGQDPQQPASRGGNDGGSMFKPGAEENGAHAVASEQQQSSVPVDQNELRSVVADLDSTRAGDLLKPAPGRELNGGNQTLAQPPRLRMRPEQSPATGAGPARLDPAELNPTGPGQLRPVGSTAIPAGQEIDAHIADGLGSERPSTGELSRSIPDNGQPSTGVPPIKVDSSVQPAAFQAPWNESAALGQRTNPSHSQAAAEPVNRFPDLDTRLAKQLLAENSIDQFGDSQLPGEPIRLVDAVSKTTVVRTRLVRSYWETYAAYIRMQFAVQQQQWLDRIQHPAGAADRKLLDAARDNGESRVLQRETMFMRAQCELAMLLPPDLQGSLPVPVDTPLVGKYRTNYDYYKTRLGLSRRLGMLDRILPKLYELIHEQAESVEMGRQAVEQTVNAYNRGQTTLAAALQAIHVYGLASNAFVASVNDYNRSISEYALNVAPGQAPHTVAKMLIPVSETRLPTDATSLAADRNGQTQPSGFGDRIQQPPVARQAMNTDNFGQSVVGEPPPGQPAAYPARNRASTESGSMRIDRRNPVTNRDRGQGNNASEYSDSTLGGSVNNTNPTFRSPAGNGEFRNPSSLPPRQPDRSGRAEDERVRNRPASDGSFNLRGSAGSNSPDF